MEMTRWGLGKLKEETGVGTVDVANRMADYGIDPYWMSHEPWVVPEPFTPEAGEMYSKEDLDEWIAVIAAIVDEAYANPERVKSAPHAQPIHQIKSAAAGGSPGLGHDLAGLSAQAWQWEKPVAKPRERGQGQAAGGRSAQTRRGAPAAPGRSMSMTACGPRSSISS